MNSRLTAGSTDTRGQSRAPFRRIPDSGITITAATAAMKPSSVSQYTR